MTRINQRLFFNGCSKLSVILPSRVVLEAQWMRTVQVPNKTYQRIWSESVSEHHSLTILIKLIIIHISLASISPKTYSIASWTRPKLGTRVRQSSLEISYAGWEDVKLKWKSDLMTAGVISYFPGIDDSLTRGSKTLAFRPTHLLKQLEALVFVVQFILRERSFLQRMKLKGNGDGISLRKLRN